MPSAKSSKTSRQVAAKNQNKASRSNARRSNNVFNVRRNKWLALVIGLVVIIAGAAGYALAAFSTDLYIRGTATVRSTVWDVHFDNLQPANLTGDFAKEVNAPTIQTSVDGALLAAIKSYDVELKEPGDAVEYTFDVVNTGDIDAVLSAVTINTGAALSCSSDAGQEVANKVCSKLNYTLTYADGTEVKAGDTLDRATNGTPTAKTMKLKLEFDPSVTTAELPEKNVMVSGLAVILSYSQNN